MSVILILCIKTAGYEKLATVSSNWTVVKLGFEPRTLWICKHWSSSQLCLNNVIFVPANMPFPMSRALQHPVSRH